MNQFLQTTNYLTQKMFYHEFLTWLTLLDEFHSNEQDPPMTANQFYWCARIQYGCALRISEALNLRKDDINLEHRILKIRNPKTNKLGLQKTSILPYDIEGLTRFLKDFKDDEQPFPVTRSTMWRYYKNAGKLGGMKLFELKEQIEIEGAWTHLMRSSCAKLYEDSGATYSLIQTKLRHSYGAGASVTERYIKRDLGALLRYDDAHFREIPSLREEKQ